MGRPPESLPDDDYREWCVVQPGEVSDGFFQWRTLLKRMSIAAAVIVGLRLLFLWDEEIAVEVVAVCVGSFVVATLWQLAEDGGL